MLFCQPGLLYDNDSVTLRLWYVMINEIYKSIIPVKDPHLFEYSLKHWMICLGILKIFHSHMFEN